MEYSLRLRCTKCRTYLGLWQFDRDEYACNVCGTAYYRKNGVLDFISAHVSSDNDDLSAGQMSSFAKPTVEASDWEGLAIRLQVLLGDSALNDRSHATPIMDRSGRMMLDIGCGYGGLVTSAAKNFRTVVGVDADLEQLQSAPAILRERFPENLILIRAWAENLPFMPGQFDAITCVQALEHVLNPEAVIAQIRSGLAPLGRLYLAVPNRFTLRREPHTNLRWIGYLPKALAFRYARLFKRQTEFQGVHLFSPRVLSGMLERAFGSSFKFIRSGCHRSLLGALAKRTWDMPLVAAVTGQIVGDLEVVAWTTQSPR